MRAILAETQVQPRSGDGTLAGEPVWSEIASVAQENIVGKLRFGATADGQPVGGLRATSMRALEFTLHDAQGTQVGRMIKAGKTYSSPRVMWRDAKTIGQYVVESPARSPEPLATIIAVSPIIVDLALNVDPSGYRTIRR